MANINVSQTFYSNDKWQFEPQSFERLRARCASADNMIRYWTEAKRMDKVAEVLNEKKEILDEFETAVKKWHEQCQK